MTDLSRVTLTIDHPFGKIEVPLEQWITTGPGPRIFVRPTAARDNVTGEKLPLSIIPVEYRNDEESLDLIVKGKIADPWHRDLQELKRGLERMP